MPGIIWSRSNTISYRWEGDLILRDTSTGDPHKASGRPGRQSRTDIRERISFADSATIQRVLMRLADKGALPTGKGPGDFDRRAVILWDFVAQSLSYVHDTERHSNKDSSLLHPAADALKEGDCEDGSFFLASLLIASGISPFCVRVVLGEIFDEHGRSLGGHCWPIYKNESGQWCILESTLDMVPSRMPEADKLAAPGQSFQYRPHYCFNGHHLWEIFPGNASVRRGPHRERSFALRSRKVHMRKTRLPSGGWLSRMTGDWEPGHFGITEEILRICSFSRDGIALAADASQDPDFYDWYTPAAHAQTENDAGGRTTESREKAQENFVQWIRDLTRRLVRTARRDACSGLFFLGYVLHGIQDLATHRGITNAQHSFMSRLLGKGNDPDHDEANRMRARDYSLRYMKFLRKGHPRVWEGLGTYKGDGTTGTTLSSADKARLLNKRGWDLTPSAFLEYAKLNRIYRRIRSDYPVESALWETDAVVEKIIGRRA